MTTDAGQKASKKLQHHGPTEAHNVQDIWLEESVVELGDFAGREGLAGKRSCD
jgi:hypothetical protein